ncbi:hypothetical protein [Natrarchaeobaculum aegyptiacum]|uniref:Uncharacterized protein n=1 Tax=Natrarchaeobaculum aegyptiacum TaxID=745377 RepID=A0A2Z2HSZ5_9EURY|nr:hypothetical protein [Natrarchaeobaculum aegyptiacum]ARS90351.1 hypothetical protein B1756_11865 [Natrarchaeobaculum aegyptiacum]
MTPPPSAALFLLGVWVVVLFAATNVAAFHQRRTTDVSEIRTPVGAGDDSPRDDTRAAGGARANRAGRTETDAHDGDASSGRETVRIVADD